MGLQVISPESWPQNTQKKYSVRVQSSVTALLWRGRRVGLKSSRSPPRTTGTRRPCGRGPSVEEPSPRGDSPAPRRGSESELSFTAPVKHALSPIGTMAATDQGRICCGLGSCTQMKLCHMCRQIQEGVAHAAFFFDPLTPRTARPRRLLSGSRSGGCWRLPVS